VTGEWQTGVVPPILRAGHVTLRPLGEGEVDELAAMLTRPGVREWWGPLDDAEHTREGLLNDGAAFAIEVDGTLAGWLGYNEETDPDHRYASLDIFLAPEYQDQGLGPAALRLAAEWLFEQRGHHRLTIDPACENVRAIRAYAAVKRVRADPRVLVGPANARGKPSEMTPRAQFRPTTAWGGACSRPCSRRVVRRPPIWS
jgi:aminoglycoside 6'-N-acetyltransferase